MMNLDRVKAICAAHTALEGPLLPILHAVQAAFGYVPREAIPVIANELNLSRAEVYGVVSFYHDFREEPAGTCVVKICRAEACQAVGGAALGAAVLKHFGIDWKQTSPDGRVTVEPVYCLGLCSVAPAALVDGEPHGRAETANLIATAERKP